MILVITYLKQKLHTPEKINENIKGITVVLQTAYIVSCEVQHKKYLFHHNYTSWETSTLAI